MSLTSFFLKNQVVESEISVADNSRVFLLGLDTDDLHHAKVMRLVAGEHIGVIDSAGVYYECEIADFTSEGLFVKNSTKINANHKIADIWMFPGLAKGSKNDEVVRACTEIGCSGFSFVSFSRSVVKLDNQKAQKRMLRLRKIAKSASMQSGAHFIAKVNEILNVNKLCKCLESFDFVIVFWEEASLDSNISGIGRAVVDAAKELDRAVKIAVIIGPEGGISTEEISRFKSANDNVFIASLGGTILRTETANIVAAATLKYEIERNL